MSIRTAVFVDGYNLYYGRLRGTAYKWLDLVNFSNQLLANRTQNEILTRVCLCTAHAFGTFATHGTNSVESQASYHRALQALHGGQIEIIYGEHSWDKSGTSMPMFDKSIGFDRTKTVRVWKIEEKQTDVNLALAMYRECAKGLCDRIIVMSNDRDIVPALIAIKADFPHIVCGIIFPLKPSIGTATNRRKSGSLEQIADWKIDSISDDTLTLAQMPAKVPVAGKKTIIKPSYW
jgi:uncharacterized LabA/DUF88 family protein